MVKNEQFEIDFRELFNIFFNSKYIIISITGFFAICSVIYSLLLPNIYQSNALLAPAQPSESLSSQIGGYASLANVAGINIPGESYDKSVEAIERIKSYDFFEKEILPSIKIENLLAEKSWDVPNDLIIYDDNLFDSKKNAWVRDVEYPAKKIPSNQEAHSAFKKILFISQDKKTGFYKITLEHISPNIARDWTSLIVKKINETMRNIDREDASKSISFLNERLNQTFYSEIKIALSELIQDQTQKLMLAESNEFYVFKLLDSPIAPELKSKPSRSIICIFGTILGFLFSLFISFINFYKKKKLF